MVVEVEHAALANPAVVRLDRLVDVVLEGVDAPAAALLLLPAGVHPVLPARPVPLPPPDEASRGPLERCKIIIFA